MDGADVTSTGEDDAFDDVLRMVAATDHVPQLDPPRRAGRYVVGPRLGRGGLGVVHRARDPELGRDVALKFVRPELTGGPRGEIMQARLRREAKALAALAHPAIVQVFDVGSVGRQVYIAMELIEGRSLRRWAAQPGVELDAIVHAFVQAAEGLAAAHAAGVVHRDFKPDNVLVGDDGRVVVVDFGLAVPDPAQTMPSTDASPGDSRLTQTGATVGTRGYVAPELCDGGEATPQSDQYAFCVSLHEALCGERPKGGRISEALPGSFRSIVHKGLDPDPARRFASMAELIEALRRRRSTSARIVAVGLGALAFVAGAWWIGSAIVRTVEVRACADEARAAIPEPTADEREAIGAAIARHVAPGRELENAAGFARTLGSWRAGHEAACVAAVRDPDGERDLATVLRCFAVRDAELRAAATALVEGLPPGLADEVAADLLTVSPVEGTCVDPRWLEVQEPSLDTDVDALAELELERSLWAALATAQADDEAKAIALLDDVAAAARERGSTRVWVRALHARARCLRVTAGVDAAIEALEHAYEIAAAKREDDLAAAVAVSLVEVLSTKTPADALVWGRTASALIDRLGATESLLAARLHTNTGVTLEQLGEIEAAVAEHERALEIREGVLGADALSIAESHANLGGLLLRLAQHDAAERAYARALEIMRVRLGSDDIEVAKAIANLALIRQAAGKRGDALASFEEARAMAVRARGPRSGIALLYGQEVARLRGEQGDLEYAERELLAIRRVLASTMGADDQEALRPWFVLAKLYADAGREDEAIELYTKLQASLEATVGSRALPYGAVRHELAKLQQRRGDHAAARAGLLDALEYTTASTPASHPVRLAVLLELAVSERALGMTESALARCDEVLAHAEANATAPPSTVASALLERARLRIDTDRVAALADAKRALEILDAQGDAVAAADARALVERVEAAR